MAANRERALAAGLDVVDFPLLAHGTVAGERVAMSYLNGYVGNGFVVVPTSGDADLDEEALRHLGDAFPGREIVGTPAMTLAYGGGGPHCITQQIPAVG
jgi:agmatine deiminase